jgi:hypothetical protein
MSQVGVAGDEISSGVLVYRTDDPPVTHDHHEHPEPGEDFAPWKLAYADAMAGVHPRHPDDLDVAGLYAER